MKGNDHADSADTPPGRRRCSRCYDQGRVKKPCPICGALAVAGGGVVYQAGSIFGDQAPVAQPKRSRPDR
jgi:hypothetical protein